MKKYIIYLGMLLICFAGNAQNEILDESTSDAIPFSEIDFDGKNYNFTISEKYEGEFEEDPIKFLNTYFNAAEFFKKNSHKKYTSLEMYFKTSTGGLMANLNADGVIKKTSHKCRDILVPPEVREKIYSEYPGWTMVENTHIANGKAGKIDKEYFKVKLMKDGKVKKVKIPFKKSNKNGIAGH